MAASRILRTTLGISAMAVLLAVGVAHSTGKPPVAPTAAEEAFPDAPYGVDSMVTGPTTASFRQRQTQFGCGEAEWPNIPAACYP